MAQKALIFMIFILLSCQNDQENERKNKEKSVSEAEKIVQKQKTDSINKIVETQLERFVKIERAKADSIKKIPRTKTTKPSTLDKNHLYFICDKNKVILVKENVASGEFSTFLVENISCSTSNLMYNNNPVYIGVKKRLVLSDRILEGGSNQYTYIFEKTMIGKKITEIPKETITPDILDKIINMGNGKRLSYSSIYLNKVQSQDIKNLLLN